MNFDIYDKVYIGTVESASSQGPAAPGTIAYVLAVNTSNGPLSLGPCVSYQRLFKPDQVVAWPVGTPLQFAMIAGQMVGAFPEPPAVEDCQP